MAAPHQIISAPLTVVNGLLAEQAPEQLQYKALFNTVAARFQQGVRACPELLQQVPVLTQHSAETLPAGSLVRFRGMVVDMLNPEFFLGAFKAAASGDAWRPAALYTDEPPADVGSATRSVIMERRPLLLTPVPYEQPWAAAAWAGTPAEPPTPCAMDRVKRSRDVEAGMEVDDTAAAAATAAPAAAATATAAAAAKQARKGGCGAGGDATAQARELQQQRDQGGGARSHQQQQQQQDEQEEGAAAAGGGGGAPRRAPTYAPGDCIVQVYGDGDAFRLHDVVEVLGVVSLVPGLAALHLGGGQAGGGGGMLPGAAAAGGGEGAGGAEGGGAMDVDDAGAGAVAGAGAAAAGGGAHGGGGAVGMQGLDEFLWQERVAALPPTSQVLRLHALCTTKVPPNPLLPPAPAAAAADGEPAAADAGADPAPEAQQAPLLRGQVLSLLSAALGGDDLAAEYLLLTCLGTVVGRDEGGAVGLLPLNISRCPAPAAGAAGGASSASRFVQGVAAALGCLLPHVAPLPLTLPALNREQWYPEQHAATGRLLRGILQAPEGALLVLDESRMAAGQLHEQGVKNLQALHQVLSQQQLPCGCQVYSQNLAVNLPAVILSAGGRSLLRDTLPLLQLPLSTPSGLGGLAAMKPGFSDAAGGSGGGGGGASHGDSAAAAAAAAGCGPGGQAADDALVACGPEAVAAAAAALPDLPRLRQYLAAARRAGVVLDQAAAEACVGRFRALQGEEQGLGWQDLHVLVTLAKLLCASMGRRAFSLASFDRAVQLERMRKARVAAAQPATQAPPPAPQQQAAAAALRA